MAMEIRDEWQQILRCKWSVVVLAELGSGSSIKLLYMAKRVKRNILDRSKGETLPQNFCQQKKRRG